MASFATLPPAATLKPRPFTAHVPDDELADFKQLIRLSKVAPPTYENTNTDAKDMRGCGLPRAWLADAKRHWEGAYDWRRAEARINSFPNFTVAVDDVEDVHFVALFSSRADAVPLVLVHGWPGSFLEFLGVLDVLRQRYPTPAELPYHVVVPSLPGYGYSGGPPLDRVYGTVDAARAVDKLMVGLGFGEAQGGYVAQGGDVGATVARVLSRTSAACRAIHLNFSIGTDKRDEVPVSTLSTEDQAGLERHRDFVTVGSAYAIAHGTRPATVGLVLSSSPVALLAWVGEKFLQWSDTSPPLDEILDSVSLYWLTETLPRSLYPYLQSFRPSPIAWHQDPRYYSEKPMGYSWHHRELAPMPRAWVEKTGDLVWYRGHFEGGHFPAFEKPPMFAEDMEDFVKTLRGKGVF